MTDRLVDACAATGLASVASFVFLVVAALVAAALLTLSFVSTAPVVGIAFDVSLLIGGLSALLTLLLFSSHVFFVWRFHNRRMVS